MRSYKYNLLYLTNKIINHCASIVKDMFKKRFYRNKLIKFYDSIDYREEDSGYILLQKLPFILSASNTRSRTLFHTSVEGINVYMVYNVNPQWSGISVSGDYISIDMGNMFYSMSGLASTIIHELTHYFDKSITEDACYSGDYTIDYFKHSFEVPAFINEAWYYSRKNKVSLTVALEKVLGKFIDDDSLSEVPQLLDYYINEIKTNETYKRRYYHLL